MHPPMQFLAEPFARNGPEVVEFLRQKLVETHDDKTVRDIVLVFAEMSRQRSYKVANDSHLMGLIRQRAEAMNNQRWRTVVQEMVTEIESSR